MVPHEPVAEVIDRVVVDREEIPRLVVQQPGGGGMDAHAFRERPQEHGQALVFILIDLFGQRNKRLHHLAASDRSGCMRRSASVSASSGG